MIDASAARDGQPTPVRVTQGSRPWPPEQFHVLAKPVGAICNLDCRYCFYLDKEALYPDSRFRMSDTVLEAYLTQLIGASTGPEVTIAWQGGEPTVIGLEFFRRALAILDEITPRGMRLEHTIQTNATLLDEAWCDFLAQHRFLVGVSIDGPAPMHDRYRVDRRGAPTFERVVSGWRLLLDHGVDANILCSVHAANARFPLDVYRFFRDELGARYLQFIPIVERDPSTARGVTDRSVDPVAWGQFQCSVFDEWVAHDVGEVFVINIEAALAKWMGIPGGLCIFDERCGAALAIEHNGDVYSCDHFVDPAHRLGNVLDTQLVELVAKPEQQQFGDDKATSLPAYCRACPVRFACNGECPKNRFVTTPDGEPGLNYLCAGYREFFLHIDPTMRRLATILHSGGDPRSINHPGP